MYYLGTLKALKRKLLYFKLGLIGESDRVFTGNGRKKRPNNLESLNYRIAVPPRRMGCLHQHLDLTELCDHL